MLENIGYDPRMARWAAAADAEVGRVVGVQGGLADVLTEHGPLRMSYGCPLLQAVARDPAAAPATGDWVVVRSWPDQRHTLERVLPRSGVVHVDAVESRVDGEVRCANVDLVAFVVAIDPVPALPQVARLLAVVQPGRSTRLLVLTKSDLAPDPEAVAAKVRRQAPGLEVVCTSTVTGAGLDRLRRLAAPRRTLALIGARGQGKSSLVDALVGAEVLGTRGTPTAVRRELVPLPGGGAVVDVQPLRHIGQRGKELP